MRLQACFCSDAANARGRDAHGLGHQRTAPVRGIGRGFLNGLGNHFQPCFHGQRRYARGPCLVALEACHAFIEIPLLPALDRRLRHARPSHDLEGAMAVRCRQHDLGSPDQLAWRVAVGDQGLKLRSLGGAKVKADVIASHATNIAQRVAVGNRPSGGEH